MSLIMDAIKKAQQLRSKELKGTPFSQEPGLKDEKRRPGRRKFWIFASAGSAIILLVLLLGNSFFPILTPHQTQTVSIIEKKESPTHPVIKKAFQEPSWENAPITRIKESPSSMESLSKKKEEEPLGKQLAGEKKMVNVKPHEKIVTEKRSPLQGGPSGKSVEKTAPFLKTTVLSHFRGKGLPTHPLMKKDSRGASRKDVATNRIRKSPSSTGLFIKKKEEKPPKKKLAEEKKAVKVKHHKKIVTEKRTTPFPKEKVPLHSLGVEGESRRNSTLASDVLTSFNLGVSFSNQGNMVKAIQAYQKVIELDPTYFEAYNNMGIIYQEIGDFDRAFGAYQKSIEINPRYEKGHNNLGILLYLKGSYEETMKAFQKALAINPDNIESHINLGILFKKQGQLGKAVQSYEKALAINPFHGETNYNIALLYEQLENVEMAIGHYQKFIRLSSKTRPGLVSKVKRHLNYLMEIRKDKRG